jgi:adenylate cyclase
MNMEANSQLVPLGGAPIPLVRNRITIGSLESCDICLRFPGVSDIHCELTYVDDHWIIRPLQTVNGIRINGSEVTDAQILRPGDEIAIAERIFTYK